MGIVPPEEPFGRRWAVHAKAARGRIGWKHFLGSLAD
jgi:hypothetical protein